MDVLCDELQIIAERVFERQPKLYDLIINIPPGTTKSTIATVMFPVWCWVRDASLKVLSGSYAADLSREHSDLSRDILKSARFRMYYPLVQLRADRDAQGMYKTTKQGIRFSTSVGGAVTGMHGHLIIVDDPLNPKQAEGTGEAHLKEASKWMSHTLPTRKVDKALTPTILIMQRLHQKDPTGIILAKKSKKNIRHICLPAELSDDVHPPELREKYIDGLLDPVRLSRAILQEQKEDLGQYGYAGQFQQRPSPAEGGMFQTANIKVFETVPGVIEEVLRFWDKAGTTDAGAFTVGLKMARLRQPAPVTYLVMDIKRGQWRSDKREALIQQTAALDGERVHVGIEQEPGSGGKESAENTIRALAGFVVFVDRPSGDKATRADPFSVQVNAGNVGMIRGDWNTPYLDELSNFPNSKFKDQTDSSSGAFNKLAKGKKALTW